MVLAATMLVLGVMATAEDPACGILPLVPATTAVVGAQYGARAGLRALGGALAALALARLSEGGAGGIHTSDILALASVGLAGTVVLDRIARLRSATLALEETATALRRESDARDTLLTELGHRVRNDLASLQATTSLLSAGVRGEEARIALADMSGRVRLFGCIYRRLTSALADDAVVEMRSFLEEFCGELREAHLGIRPVTLELVSAETWLPAGRATLVGLVINEGVTNALKHAFPEGRTGRIAVGFAREGDDPGHITLSIVDDGVGLPPASLRGKGLGTRLLGALVSQLDGDMVLEAPDGLTILRIRFPA